MSRFSAASLDLSRFDPPLAIRGLDLEVTLAARKAQLKVLLAERGIDYDVGTLEFDTAVVQQEADNHRELLAHATINDKVRACMIAFAIGADLDHLAAFYGVERLTGETDAYFRRRALLAPEAFGCAGAEGAYVFHALTADPEVLNVDVWSPKPGEVFVAVQSSVGDGKASSTLVAKVRDRLHEPDVKPLTDMVTVRSVINVPYKIEADIYVLPGPDPLMVKQEVLTSLQAMAATRRTPARDIPRSAIYAAAQIGAVDKVVLRNPTVDIARDYGQVGVCTGIDLKVTTYAG